LAASAPGVHLSKALTAGTREEAALNTLPSYRLMDLVHTPWEFDWTALVAPGPIGPVIKALALVQGDKLGPTVDREQAHLRGPIGPEIKGLALFQGDKLVRTSDGEQAHLIAPIRSSGATHIIVPPLPGFDDPMTIRFRSIRIRTGRYNPGQTTVRVTIEGQAYLAEGVDYTFAPPMGPRLRAHVEAYLAQRLEDVLTELYADGIDVLDLGQQARAHSPDGEIPPEWPELLPQMTFAVETKINFLQGLRGT